MAARKTVKTARPAGVGIASMPAPLRVINGRGTRKDGQETDSGGRPILPGPTFDRRLPVKPEGLSEHASEMWDLVVRALKDHKILKPVDAMGLEIACETYARWKEAEDMRKDLGILSNNSQGNVKAPWIGIAETASREFRSWCSEFGFTPAAERHLATGDTGEDDGVNPF